MSKLLVRAKTKGRRGFTLVELLVVIVVLAVLAAIVLPKFMNSSRRSKESALRSDLKLIRNQVSLFQADTGTYPKALTDLTATTAPLMGLDNAGGRCDDHQQRLARAVSAGAGERPDSGRCIHLLRNLADRGQGVEQRDRQRPGRHSV